MSTTYRFDLRWIYEPERLKDVNKLFNSFGGEGKMTLQSDGGHIDVNIDDEVDLPEEAVAKMQQGIQEVVDERLKKFDNIEIKVQKGRKL